MRIEFDFVRWRNLLSYGNYWTEVKLNKSNTTLIVGPNGVGKSVFLDALMYGLYSKPARDINKTQMVNSITGRGLMVEIGFRIGKKEYFIRRGDAPAIFELYINGELQKASASKLDDQKNLVKNVLKMSDKSFKQIVVLGSANYVPFMQLSTGDRRKIIEDLLDIQIFSTMNALLLRKLSANRSNIQEVDTDIRIINERIQLNRKHIATLRQNNDELIEERRKRIDKLSEELEDLVVKSGELNGQIAALQVQAENHGKLNKKLEDLVNLEKQLEDRARKLKKDIEFFHDNENCPTCKQGIEHEFKIQATKVRQERLEEINGALSKLADKYQSIREELAEMNGVQEEISKLNTQLQDINSTISFNNKNSIALQQEIEQLEKKTDKIEVGEEELKTNLKELSRKTKVKERLSKHQSVLEVASVLLKDSGIKTKIIKQYVPIMNKLVNKYLAQMDFFCNFELDENFNEKIKSRHRDVFGYNNFSEGQKARIDLALLFTWRSIAKLRNSAGTNILVMDEIFDGSLDANGTDELLKIIQDLVGDTQTFVISHKDTMYDKFHSVIEFEMVQNFSHMKKAEVR